MKSITITLKVTDEESLEYYSDCDPSFIKCDLMYGDLLEACEVFSGEVEK